MERLFYFLCIIFCTFAADASAKVQLIWQVGENFCEIDWVKEVLSLADYEEIIDGNYKTIRNHAIIVVSEPTKASQAYFNKLRRRKYKFGIIHLSDEFYQHDTAFYAGAQFILRNLWHKKFKCNPKVFFFPLGYNKGFWSQWDQKPLFNVSERQYSWSFAGQIKHKPNRKRMVQAMKNIPSHFFHETFQFGDSKGLSRHDYRQLMLDTIFIPCPTGFWNLDSFRVYEALECGCIPIVLKQPLDYFKKQYGDHPFIAVDHWSEAPEIVNRLLDDPTALEERRQRCYKWWQKYKMRLKNQVADLVKRL